MKEGYVEHTGGVPDAGELQQINKLARRSLSADEVFVFSVILCDNEIDRDFERFSDTALQTMAKLYVGKTGIFDHSMKGRDQVARIFSCEVEKPQGQTTSYGAPYVRVKARAYMPRTEKNRDLITEIDAGIKKEVSVGCSVAQTVCSVCGADQRARGCEHQKGRIYQKNGKDLICHHVLDGAADAYEWSFVAVPAQRGAGVVKAFGKLPEGGKKETMTDVVKRLNQGEGMTLSAHQARELADYVKDLEQTAKAGQHHAEHLLKETVKMGAIAQPSLEGELLFKMLSGLSYKDLCLVHGAYVKQMDGLLPPVSQLEPIREKMTAPIAEFENFKI